MKPIEYYTHIKTKFEVSLCARLEQEIQYDKVYGSRKHIQQMHTVSTSTENLIKNSYFLRLAKYAGFYYDIIVDSQ